MGAPAFKLDDVFAALGHETRRRIVEILAAEEAVTPSRIHAEFTLSGPAVSQHLSWLRQTGIIKAANGKNDARLYSLNHEAVEAVLAWFARVQATKPKKITSRSA